MDIDVFLDDLFDEEPTQTHDEGPSTSGTILLRRYLKGLLRIGTMAHEEMDTAGNDAVDEYEWSAIQMRPEHVEGHALILQEYPVQEKECIVCCCLQFFSITCIALSAVEAGNVRVHG